MSTNLEIDNKDYEIREIYPHGSNLPEIQVTEAPQTSVDKETSDEQKYQSLALDTKGKNVCCVNDFVESRNNPNQKCPDLSQEQQNNKYLTRKQENEVVTLLSLQPEDKDPKYLSLLPEDKDAKYLKLQPEDKDVKYLSLLPEDKNAKYLSLLPENKDAKYLSLMGEKEEGYERLSNKPDASCQTGGPARPGGIEQRKLPPVPNHGIYETLKPKNDYEDNKHGGHTRAAAVRLFLKNRRKRRIGAVCVLGALAVIVLVSCLLYFYLQSQPNIVGLGESRVFCYYSGDAQSRSGPGSFVPKDIDVALCTHLIFRYAKIENKQIIPSQIGDDATYLTSGLYEQFNALKQNNSRLKTLLSVGGNSPSQNQSEFKLIGESLNELRSFVFRAITFLRTNEFDGIDFRWLYPTLNSEDSERYLYTQWLQEIRNGFDAETKRPGRERLLLMATVSPGKYIIDNVYNKIVPEISYNVDFLNVLGYNIHQATDDSVTAHHSPLYASPNNTLIKHRDVPHLHTTLSQAWALNYWLKKGAPREKLVLAFGFYSSSFTLANASDHSLGAPSVGRGTPGRITNIPGALAYYEVCENLGSGWESVYDEVQQAVYAFKGDQWVSYENERSIAAKTKYVRDLRIAGVSIVSVDLDDFSGAFCNLAQPRRYPLLSTIARILLKRAEN